VLSNFFRKQVYRKQELLKTAMWGILKVRILKCWQCDNISPVYDPIRSKNF